MDSTLITGPAKLPVSVGEVKAHARIENELEDALLYGWIVTATEQAQKRTSRQLITASWRTYFDAFPAEADDIGEYALELPWAPLQAVSAVKYIDPDGATQTLAGASYRVDTVGVRGRVVLADAAAWPSAAARRNAVWVEYTAGYGVEPHQVPEPIRSWIAMQVATRREFREALGERAPAPLPRDYVDGLLDDYTTPVLG